MSEQALHTSGVTLHSFKYFNFRFKNNTEISVTQCTLKKPSKRTETSPYNVDNSIHHLALFVALSTERIPLFALRLTQLG